jgi:hypothetical protein
MQPVPQGKQVEKFEVTEREKYLLKIIAAMIAKEPCLQWHYDVKNEEDARAAIFRVLCKTIEELTTISPL